MPHTPRPTSTKRRVENDVVIPKMRIKITITPTESRPSAADPAGHVSNVCYEESLCYCDGVSGLNLGLGREWKFY